jgi:hypothetical protein
MATRKAKRKLSDISFEKEGAHVALVSKEQGGPANLHDYALVLKANKFSDEFVEKMQQVRVTMELPDFLQKFFNMWSEDAKVLATMMGYVEPADTQQMENEEAQAEMQDWIESRMEAFEILKSVKESENISEVLSTLDEDSYLAMLKDQELIEKAFEKLEKAYKPKVGDMVEWNSSGGKAKGKIEHVMTEGTLGVPGTEFSVNATKENPAALIRIYRDGKPTETMVGHKSTTLKKISKVSKESKLSASAEADDTSPASEVIKEEVSASINQENLEKSTMDENQKEMVEKATLELLQKSFDEQKVALEKALETLAVYEAEKKAAIEKARKDQIVAAVKDEAKAETLFKAVKDTSDEDFAAVVKALAEMQEAIEKSALFQEQGSSAQDESEIVQESAVAKLLKAKQAK